MADETLKEKLKEFDFEIVSEMDFKTMTQKIAEYLYNYTLKTKYHYSKEYPKILGNVSFWLEEKDGRMMLMYSHHPKQWNMNWVASELEKSETEYYNFIMSGKMPYNINGLY